MDTRGATNEVDSQTTQKTRDQALPEMRAGAAVVAAAVLLITGVLVGFGTGTGTAAATGTARLAGVTAAVLAAVIVSLWRSRPAPLRVHVGLTLLTAVVAITSAPLLALPAAVLLALAVGWDLQRRSFAIAGGVGLAAALLVGAVVDPEGASILPALPLPPALALGAHRLRGSLRVNRSRRQMAELISRASSRLVETSDPSAVQQIVLHAALQVVSEGTSPAGPALLLNREQDRIVAAAGPDSDRLDGRRLEDDGPPLLAAVTKDPFLMVAEGEDAQRLCTHLGTESFPVVLLAPLTNSETGHAKMVLHLHHRPDEEVSNALDALSDLGAIAIAQVECADDLQLSDARFKSLVQDSADVIMVIDLEGDVRYASPSMERVFGHSAEQLMGAPLWTHLHPEDGFALQTFLATAVISGRPDDAETIRMRDSAGGWRWVEMRGRPLHNDCGSGCAFHKGSAPEVVANLRDVTDRETLRQQLEHQAFHDQLTGLPNRALLLDRLELALAAAARHGQLAAVLFVDLDDFKAVNDSLGHSHGEQLLKDFAERLATCAGPGDTAARMGGDEFSLLLPVVEDGEHAQRVGESILDCLTEVFEVDGISLRVRASIGVDTGAAPATAEDLLRRADVAMYLAKSEGGNTVRHHSLEDGLDDLGRLRMTAELQRAVEREEIVAYFQPIVDLRDHAVVGFEALVRWEHPTLGLLPPDRFLPLAESVGLIAEIDLGVLRQACEHLRRWQLFAGTSRQLSMHVNMSGLNVMHAETIGRIRGVLDDTGIEPGAITIELTEGVLLHGALGALEQLRSLKDLGVLLAVDDFGVGYSSLSYLQQFPVDVLKIDRSFVESLDGTHADGTIARSIIDLANSLNLELIAEGIERHAQLRSLKELDCPLGQGFLLARPLTPEAAEAIVRDGVVFHAEEQPVVI